MIRSITSDQNESFKRWKFLDQSKGIKKQGQFFLMGEKLIKEFLKNPNLPILAEILGPDHRSVLSSPQNVPSYQLAKDLFNQLDVVGTHFNLLLLEANEFSKEAWTAPQGLELILPLGDPSNLGAALRSACAFGVKKVILTEEAAHPYHPKAIKASAGAALKVDFSKTGRLAEVLSQNPKIVVLEKGGQPLTKFPWPKDLYLAAGEEGPGLPAHDCVRVSIATENVESLNAAIAVSLACFAFKHYSDN